MSLIAVAIVGLWVLYQPAINYFTVVLLLVITGLVIWIRDVFYRMCLASIALNVFLNGMFYPDVLQYQSGSSAAFYANRELKGQPVGLYRWNSYALNYYLDAPLERYDSIPAAQPVLIFTAGNQKDSLVLKGYTCKVIQAFPHFPVTKLDLPFVNHYTRRSAIEERFLVLVSGRSE